MFTAPPVYDCGLLLFWGMIGPMKETPFIPRNLPVTLLITILIVSTCSAGETPFWKRLFTSDEPPAPPVKIVAPPPTTQPPPQPTPVVAPTVSAPAVPVTLPLEVSPRQPRTSRFIEAADSHFSNRLLTEDTIWKGQVLVEGGVTIAPQATVTIEPGTTVRFRPSADGAIGLLLIRGRIRAVGTKDLPITFTSDEVAPAAGDWQGILLLDSSKDNILEWCRIDATVTGVSAVFSELTLRQSSVTRSRTGVVARSSHLIVAGGGVTGCLTGYSFQDGDVELDAISARSNRQGVKIHGGSLSMSAAVVIGSEESAVDATGARLRLEGSSIVANGSGAILNGCRGDLVANRIVENRTTGLELTASPLKVFNNRISGNGSFGVVVHSGGGTLWDNALEGNQKGGLLVSGADEVTAVANWWGSSDPERVRGAISKGGDSTITYIPFLAVAPILLGSDPVTSSGKMGAE